MGRKRRETDKWMPERVYRGRSAYEWRPKGGRYVRLCGLDANREEVWAAYSKAKTEAIAEAHRPILFGDLMDHYFGSEQFRERKPATQTDYLQSAGKLRAVFGQAEPAAITAYVLRQSMDRRGKKAKTRANRERSLMGTVWVWAFEPDLTSVRSPVPDVRPWKETARDRYVTDAEYLAVYRAVTASVRVAMEISYLCAARQSDALSLRWGRQGYTEPDAGQAAVVLEQGIYTRCTWVFGKARWASHAREQGAATSNSEVLLGGAATQLSGARGVHRGRKLACDGYTSSRERPGRRRLSSGLHDCGKRFTGPGRTRRGLQAST